MSVNNDDQHTDPGRPSAFFASVEDQRFNLRQRVHRVEDRVEQLTVVVTVTALVLASLIGLLACVWVATGRVLPL
jgi:hypothetical protein